MKIGPGIILATILFLLTTEDCHILKSSYNWISFLLSTVQVIIFASSREIGQTDVLSSCLAAQWLLLRAC